MYNDFYGLTFNPFSKGISDISFGTKEFFLSQSVTFLCAGLCLLSVSENAFDAISPVTVSYGVIYGIMLIGAQYCYTCALRGGNMGMCSTIYSMGFILPTLSGFLFWREKLKIASRATEELVTLSVSSAGSSPPELIKIWYSATWQKHHFVYVITLSRDSFQGCKLFKRRRQ